MRWLKSTGPGDRCPVVTPDSTTDNMREVGPGIIFLCRGVLFYGGNNSTPFIQLS